MMTAHLAILSFFIGRPIGRARPGRAVPQVDERPRGRWAALLRRPWQERAPPLHRLNNHLRRDIGLPPLDERNRWPRW
ncbi:hypothetical protein [Rhodospirillaceae bacterium SYSU D60014]|uniref:hypothetical protein n=1 Tax=Virgifigura deserti TaxID=2268457 RepID=UPI000E662B40